MRQHKVFLRHELLKYNSEKSTAKSSALENYISSANLSLSGCSSAEPDSVSVGACKFQMKKLYLQTVKKVDHLPIFIDIYGFRKTLAIRMRCQQSITTLRDLSDSELAGRICFGRICSDGHRNILQHGLVMIILNGSFYSIFLGRDQCQSTED